LTEPAIWIAPENSSSFSVSVVLPASGWEMMAKVRRRRVSDWKDKGDCLRQQSLRFSQMGGGTVCQPPGGAPFGNNFTSN
jgi:hypothetical protein